MQLWVKVKGQGTLFFEQPAYGITAFALNCYYILRQLLHCIEHLWVATIKNLEGKEECSVFKSKSTSDSL